jgi:hypothetical protein
MRDRLYRSGQEQNRGPTPYLIAAVLGVSVIVKNDKNEVRRYLLGELEDAEQEELELRLLTDAAFAEEFDTIVDELTDEYVANDIDEDERKRVEQYFLRATERQSKAKFADELLQRAATERGGKPAVTPTVPAGPMLFERVRAFWGTQPFSLRMVTIVATIVIVVGLVFLVSSRRPISGSYASINLKLVTSARATGPELKIVKLLPDTAGVDIELALPEQLPQSPNYRVELIDARRSSRNLPVVERKAQSLIVRIPRHEITYGNYIIHLHGVNAGGSEQRIHGGYYFNVE